MAQVIERGLDLLLRQKFRCRILFLWLTILLTRAVFPCCRAQSNSPRRFQKTPAGYGEDRLLLRRIFIRVSLALIGV
ncbi:MAG: hypothetical protein A3A44_02795 [Candidatus Sungbacteria bacterium RIFCSPLOWO2_01_FULL_60_25]|uniref:Uncharacterized protein n=1 Tax=Candidatus Sungbacteria bacterium RIFCSPLOWO2_01_FULL_60_25 TaxID=1802281 RepID=A0A1G2LE95_9BACT|nr:MAG: hypothetical protein A3A44_02795 [Candidatus Sungbacteria bacterium RIFCSPLOWO2_01_FULL_60_25]